MLRRRWRWFAGALALLLVVAFFAARMANEPMRRRIEASMNQALDGYTVRIGGLRYHPLGFSLVLLDTVVVQDANPDPPVASIPRLSASVQWREALRLNLVAGFEVREPTLHLDLRHARAEATDEKSVAERGWQEAVQEIYPLEINLFEVIDGSVTYIEPGPAKPVRLTHFYLTAENIRNVASGKGTYPSEVHVSTWLQDTARLQVDGRADFLAVPHPGVKAEFQMTGLELRHLAPVMKHAGAEIRSGRASAWGGFEYAPKHAELYLQEVQIAGADVTYVKSTRQQASLSDAATTGAAAVTQQPAATVKADRIVIDRSTLGYRDETIDPPYRIYMADTHAELHDFTNVKNGGDAKPGRAAVRGMFMETGRTRLDATFQPHEKRTDFSLSLAVDDTDARRLNDLWRAYGGFDVERGLFSVYSELAVRQGRVDGYVKTILKDLDVLGPEDEQSLGRKIYEGVVGGVATMLQNQPRDQVAIEVGLSGPLENPDASTLEIIGSIVKNAFFKAVLPGFRDD